MSKIKIAAVFGVLVGVVMYTGNTFDGLLAVNIGLWVGSALHAAMDIIEESR